MNVSRDHFKSTNFIISQRKVNIDAGNAATAMLGTAYVSQYGPKSMTF